MKILKLKKSTQKSLLAEYFYAVLGILLCLITVFLMGAGMGFYESTVIGLWVVAIIFFIRQVVRSIKGQGQAVSKREEKAKPVTPQAEAYTPPATPRVSKNFSPMPPAGDKRYPPPSPFIKPPK